MGVPRNQRLKTSRMKEADRLKKLRSTLGMNQRAFAKEFLVSQGAIALWETGDRTIPGPVLKLIEIYESRIQKGKWKFVADFERDRASTQTPLRQNSDHDTDDDWFHTNASQTPHKLYHIFISSKFILGHSVAPHVNLNNSLRWH